MYDMVIFPLSQSEHSRLITALGLESNLFIKIQDCFKQTVLLWEWRSLIGWEKQRFSYKPITNSGGVANRWCESLPDLLKPGAKLLYTMLQMTISPFASSWVQFRSYSKLTWAFLFFFLMMNLMVSFLLLVVRIPVMGKFVWVQTQNE